MATYRQVDDLDKILDDHKKWLRGEGGERADLRETDLRRPDFRKANLQKANLQGAGLQKADLRRANLRKANLRKANLRGANLRKANLSQTKGLLAVSEWMEDHLESTSDGYISYKDFGFHYDPPEAWTIKEGAVIEEVVNPCRTIECACGVNVGTQKWVANNVTGEVWKVLIRWEWLPDVVVPYRTDGKFRCGRVELIRKVK